MRRLHIFVSVDKLTDIGGLQRLVDSLDTALLRHHLDLFSVGPLEKELEQELVQWAKEKKLQLYILKNPSQLETVLKQSIWQYVVLLRWSDIVYPNAIDKLSVAITNDPVDIVMDVGGDWLSISKINEFSILYEAPDSTPVKYSTCTKDEAISVPRLVLLSRKYVMSQNRLPIIFSNFRSAQQDMECYLRSVQQDNCHLSTLKFFDCPLFIKDPRDYNNSFVKFPELFQNLSLVPHMHRLDVYIPKEQKEICLKKHVYTPWFDETLINANQLFEEQKWTEALKLYLTLKSNDITIDIKKAECYWKMHQWHVSLQILYAIEEPNLDVFRIMASIYAETNDDAHELEVLEKMLTLLNQDLTTLIMSTGDMDEDENISKLQEEKRNTEIHELEIKIDTHESKIKLIRKFLSRDMLHVMGEKVPESELWKKTEANALNCVKVIWSDNNSQDDLQWQNKTIEEEPELIEDTLEALSPDWCSRSYPAGFKEDNPTLILDDLPDPSEPDPIPSVEHRQDDDTASSIATEQDIQEKNDEFADLVPVNELRVQNGTSVSKLEEFLFDTDESARVKVKMLSIATDAGPMWVPPDCEVINAIDGQEIKWTATLSQIFFTKEHLLVMLDKEECHHYMTDKIGTLLSHRQLMYIWVSDKEKEDEQWLCVLQDNIRGLRHFNRRLTSLMKSINHVLVTTLPDLDVVFLNKTNADTTRLCFGIERMNSPKVGSKALGYLIRRSAVKNFIVNGIGITESHIGAWFSKHMVCAQANPPLIWRRRMSIKRDAWIIKKARPVLVVYGMFQSFMKPIFAEFVHMFQIRFYLSFGGDNVKLGNHVVNALNDFTAESVKDAHVLLLLDTIDILLHNAIMIPAVLWFTGNDAYLKRSKMLLWYTSKNQIPIHRVLVNHHSQAKFLKENYYTNIKMCTLVPLLPWITRNTDDCNKVQGRILCRYSDTTFDKFMLLLEELKESNIQYEAVVIGTQINHEHLSYGRKSRGKVQFFGLLSENEMLDELFESDYFWTYTTPVQSLDIALVELAQYCGCVTISNCGVNVLNPDDTDSIKEIITDNDKKTKLRNMCLKFRDSTIKKNVVEYWRRSLYYNKNQVVG